MSYVAKNKYGCKPSRRHVGDLHYACATIGVGLPPVFSWRAQCSAPFDQGQTGSCTGQSTSKILQLRRAIEGKPALPSHPSQFFLYANARIAEGTLDQDAGATIRDVAMAATVNGFCDATVWPSDGANPSDLLVKPSDAAYAAAKPEAGLSWAWINGKSNGLINALKTAIGAGDPVLFGISVYESFESDHVAKTGRVPLPHYWEQLLGGHAIAMVGWNDHIRCFEFANSWGLWGDKGYGWLPYSYVTNQHLAQDFGAIQAVP